MAKTIKPEEKVASFVESQGAFLSKNDNNLSEDSKPHLFNEKILSLLPKNECDLFRLTWDVSTMNAIKRVPMLMDSRNNESLALTVVNNKKFNNSRKFLGICFKCGARGHRAEKCRGTAKCVNCGKIGHSARICKESSTRIHHQSSEQAN